MMQSDSGDEMQHDEQQQQPGSVGTGGGNNASSSQAHGTAPDDANTQPSDNAHTEAADEPLMIAGMPSVLVDSFQKQNVHQVLPADITSVYGPFLGEMLKKLSADSGTHPAILGCLLPAAVAVCVGPGLVVTPNKDSTWRIKANFWAVPVAESGAGDDDCIGDKPIKECICCCYQS